MLVSLAAVLALAPSPNFVVILCDDLGYGDVGAYGNRAFATPNIDRLAKEGARFTDFYVASPACSPSRAALLTGCYPVRVSVPQVLFPDSATGLNPEETTLPEVLKPMGYATACVGKWHLGVKNLMPRTHGFDTYFGLPYSNDMWPTNGKAYPPLRLFHDEQPGQTIATMDDQATLTRQYTKFATSFIEQNKAKPFFLYLAHSMPHVPIAASGSTTKGLYAATVREIDGSVGDIIRCLRKNRLDRNTVVVFTSDNGPWLPYGNHAGSSGGLREGKSTTFEGGFRVPGIFWGPGKIPAGTVTSEVASTMDLLPTFAAMAGAKAPERKIDGHDIRNLITNAKGAKSPWNCFYYYWPGELQAVRSGKWKLHVPHGYLSQTKAAGKDGVQAGQEWVNLGLSLYNLAEDPGEQTNVAGTNPDVVQRLLSMIEIGRRELGDDLTKTKGSEVRPPGRIDGS